MAGVASMKLIRSAGPLEATSVPKQFTSELVLEYDCDCMSVELASQTTSWYDLF